MSDQRLGVIDVGSNSGRIVVIRLGPEGHLEVLADSRAPLRLARDLQRGAQLTRETIDRTAAALRDFRAVAESAGAPRMVAVATAAVREAENGAELIDRIQRQGGVEVRVISGEAEASQEISRFEDRRLVGSWTLPLGALRLSDRFLRSDPPRPDELDELQDHATAALRDAGLGTIGADQQVIGTGGTIRNLARVDRHIHPYPIPRLHGYVLDRGRIKHIGGLLASRKLVRRRRTPGLNPDRADSIVGGTLVALAFLDSVGASHLVVSGEGLREGIALDTLTPDPPPVDVIREASIRSLVSRFSAWDRQRAERRAGIAMQLLGSLRPEADPSTRRRLADAATVLDIGRSVDYYRRHRHAADMLTEADLAGFSHRSLALLAAVVRNAGDEGSVWQAYRPILSSSDRGGVAEEGTMLALADEIEQRMPPGVVEGVACEDRRKSVVLTAPVFDPWRREALIRRFGRVFRKRLVIRDGGDGDA